MVLDYDISNCTRRCASGGRPLAPGEEYFSTLKLEGGTLVRKDYAGDAWTGPGEGVVAWWKASINGASPSHQPPQEALVSLFAALADEPDQVEFRYLLGLLMIRRKWLRVLEPDRPIEAGWLRVQCPQREEEFELLVAPPKATRAVELEQRLAALLDGKSDGRRP